MLLRENFILALPGMLPPSRRVVFQALTRAAGRAFALEFCPLAAGMSIGAARGADLLHHAAITATH
jgi:hypothetical protein